MRKQDNVPNGISARKHHHQAIDAHPDPAGRRHAVFKSEKKIFIQVLDFFADLLQQALALGCGIVQLRIAG